MYNLDQGGNAEDKSQIDITKNRKCGLCTEVTWEESTKIRVLWWNTMVVEVYEGWESERQVHIENLTDLFYKYLP